MNEKTSDFEIASDAVLDSLLDDMQKAAIQDPSVVKSLALRAESRADSLGLTAYRSKVYYGLAMGAFFENDSEKALSYCDSLISSFHQEAMTDTMQVNGEIARALQLKGIVIQRNGNYEEAMAIFLDALEHYEKSNAQNNMGTMYVNVAENFRLIRKHQEALEYLDKAEAEFSKADQPEQLATVYLNRGVVFNQMGENIEALEAFGKSYELAKKHDHIIGQINALNNIGVIEVEMDHDQRAIEYYEEALRLYELHEDKYGYINTLLNIGSAYVKQGNNSKALVKVNQAMDMASEEGYPELTLFGYETLARAYESTSDFKQSLDYSKLSIQLRDSLYNQGKLQEISLLERRYQQAKNERAIAQKDNEIFESELQQRKLLLSTIILGLVILFSLFVLAMIIRQSKFRKAKNDELQSMNKKIQAQNTEISEKRDVLLAQKEDLEVLVQAYEIHRLKEIVVGKQKVLSDDIIYVKYHDRISTIFLKNGETIEQRTQLSHLLAELKFTSHILFSQINQNYVINFNNCHISYYKDEDEKYYYTPYLPNDLEEGRNEEFVKTRKRSGITSTFIKDYQRYLRIKDIISTL